MFEAPILSLLEGQKPKKNNQIFGVPEASDAHGSRKPWPVGIFGVQTPWIAKAKLTAPPANSDAEKEFGVRPGIYNDAPQRRALPGLDKDTIKNLDAENITSPDASLFSADGKDYNGAVTAQNVASRTVRYINAHLRGYAEVGTSIIWKQSGADSQTGVMKVYAHASREFDKTEGLKNHVFDRGMKAQILRYGLSYQDALGATSPLPGTKSWLQIPLKIAGALKTVKLADDKNIFIGSELQRLDFKKAQGAKYIYGNVWSLLGGNKASSLTGRQGLGFYSYQIPHYQRWAYSPLTFWSGAGAPFDRASYFRPLHLGIDRGQATDKYQFYAVTDLEHMGALSLYEGAASVDYRDMRILRNGSAVNIADKATKRAYLSQAGIDPDGTTADGALDTDGGIFPQMASGGASALSLDVPRRLADAATPDNSITETYNGADITRDKNDPSKIYKVVKKSWWPSWLGGADSTYVPVSAVSAYLKGKATASPLLFGGLERADEDTLKRANITSPLFFGAKESRAKSFDAGNGKSISAFNVDDTINTGFGTVAGHDGIFKLTNLRDDDTKAQVIFAHYTQQSLKNFAAYVDPGSVRKDGSIDYAPAIFNLAKDSVYWYLRTKYLTKYITLPNLAIKAINDNIVRGGTLPALLIDKVNPLAYRYTPQEREAAAATVDSYNILDHAERLIDKALYAYGGWASDEVMTALGHKNQKVQYDSAISDEQAHANMTYANFKNGALPRKDAEAALLNSQKTIDAFHARKLDLETPKYRRTMWLSLSDEEREAAPRQQPPSGRAVPDNAEIRTENPALGDTSPATEANPPVTSAPPEQAKPPQTRLVFRKGDNPDKIMRSLKRSGQANDFAANLKTLGLDPRRIRIGQEVDTLAFEKTDAAQPVQRLVRVRRGDTPLGLAREFYKDRNMAERILELNAARLVKARNGQSYLAADSVIALP